MDAICDELLELILQLLPASSSPSAALVSRRWLAALRSSTAALSVRVPDHLILSSILSNFPHLSGLTVSHFHHDSDSVLLAVAASPNFSRLTDLRLNLAYPISAPATQILEQCNSLIELHLPTPRPLCLRWLSSLPYLKSLTLLRTSPKSTSFGTEEDESDNDIDTDPKQLPIQSLSISGIRRGDTGAGWLWRRCGNLRRLQLQACDGTGDSLTLPSFPLCLNLLHELELRTCRGIAGRVLLLAADHCSALTSLLLYDGGNRDALRQFIVQRGAALRTIDLRLPLDLDNDLLTSIAASPPGLAALRLRSCCLVTGEGLRALARAPAGSAVEELALVNCDVVEREPGLLMDLGQGMRGLRMIDLSYNEGLGYKAVGAMLESCGNLVDVRLQGCKKIGDATLLSLLRCCRERMERMDVSRCPGITAAGINLFVLNAPKLNCIVVEDEKVSEAARDLISRRGIKIGEVMPN